MRKIYLYDSTLRDGAQTHGVDFSINDKIVIAEKIDELGIDYIEGGWPGANPTDDEFFASLPKLKNSKFCAFGMTRRPSTSADNDPGLNNLINSDVDHICIVGKAWDFHVTNALNIGLDDNLAMIESSIKHIIASNKQAFFDAEHFFDGYKANPAYSLKVIKTAYEAGARWVILCDTNGGTLPFEIEEIISKIINTVPGKNLGIHCHNDTKNAVANSIMAVKAGVCQVQGTLNGLGERCGNADLISIIPILKLKMGFDLNISDENLKNLTKTSKFLDARLNRDSDKFAAFVGDSAFAHKGGLHVSAVVKDPTSYEHVNPELIGNKRNIIISDQSGKSNIIARLKEININPENYNNADIEQLVDEVKKRESAGYSYDLADASFWILAHQILDKVPVFFTTESFKIIDERSKSKSGKLVILSEANVKIEAKNESFISIAQGNGPVNALDKAMRKALIKFYPELKYVNLIDYKVRIINSSTGTDAITRVIIESNDETNHRWSTVGVSTNIIDASYNALRDSYIYKLMKK